MSFNKSSKYTLMPEYKGLGDLKSKEKYELDELLNRQNQLLANKLLINKLKDKGEKIRHTRDEILKELETRNNASITSEIKNSTDYEWRDSPKISPKSTKTNDSDENVLKILASNGQTEKQYSQKLIAKEKDSDFHYRPSNLIVSEKIKKIVPQAHSTISSEPCVKTIHLEESLDLLTEQISALKILGSSRRKLVEECIEDRINESIDLKDDSDDTEELEQNLEQL